ncbi:MAG: metal-sulfur cluster assembly factor [Gemmatimonadales bacterium]
MVGASDVWAAIGTVTDPEYPLSIVDLGMVYDVEVEDGVARIDMTFTSIGCPAIDMIVDDVHRAVLGVPGISAVNVNVVWNPPWSKAMISARGRRILAMHGVVA